VNPLLDANYEMFYIVSGGDRFRAVVDDQDKAESSTTTH
jgi:hypothetical protein